MAIKVESGNPAPETEIMALTESMFAGDMVYSIDCTGDAVVGDEVCFDRAIFSGNHRRAKFEGYERVKGKIIRESYGRERGQHTFTLQLSDGTTARIKGRNLYRNGLFRKPWENETSRFDALDEKHSRGNEARAMKSMVSYL